MGHLATQKKSTGAGRSLSLGGARASLRRLFPKEAADIMRRYYHNVSTYPGETERVELARKVRSVAPCCSHYTARHVYQYFSNLRYRARAKNGVEQSLPSDVYVLSAAAPTVTSTSLNESPLPEKPSRSAEAESPGKERPSGWTTTTAQNATVRWPTASVDAESDFLPHRATIFQGRETIPSGAESGSCRRSPSPGPTEKPPGPQRSARPRSPVPSPSRLPSELRVESAAQGQDSIPGCEQLQLLATQLHLVLPVGRYNATLARHRVRPRADEPPPKSFVELATWLSERRPLLDSAAALRA